VSVIVNKIEPSSNSTDSLLSIVLLWPLMVTWSQISYYIWTYIRKTI